jgi:hypothetical protein
LVFDYRDNVGLLPIFARRKSNNSGVSLIRLRVPAVALTESLSIRLSFRSGNFLGIFWRAADGRAYVGVRPVSARSRHTDALPRFRGRAPTSAFSADPARVARYFAGSGSRSPSGQRGPIGISSNVIMSACPNGSASSSLMRLGWVGDVHEEYRARPVSLREPLVNLARQLQAQRVAPAKGMMAGLVSGVALAVQLPIAKNLCSQRLCGRHLCGARARSFVVRHDDQILHWSAGGRHCFVARRKPRMRRA